MSGYLRGDDAFPIEEREEWKRERFYKTRESIVWRLRDIADSLLREEPYLNGDLGDIGMDAYSDLAANTISSVTQGFGNMGSDFRNLVSYGHLVDALFNQDAHAYETVARSHQRLTRAAREVSLHPTSKKAQQALTALLVDQGAAEEVGP